MGAGFVLARRGAGQHYIAIRIWVPDVLIDLFPRRYVERVGRFSSSGSELAGLGNVVQLAEGKLPPHIFLACEVPVGITSQLNKVDGFESRRFSIRMGGVV